MGKVISNRAVVFPDINPEKKNWLKAVLLYYDGIKRVEIEPLEDLPLMNVEELREARDAGMLSEVPIGTLFDQSKEIDKGDEATPVLADSIAAQAPHPESSDESGDDQPGQPKPDREFYSNVADLIAVLVDFSYNGLSEVVTYQAADMEGEDIFDEDAEHNLEILLRCNMGTRLSVVRTLMDMTSMVKRASDTWSCPVVYADSRLAGPHSHFSSRLGLQMAGNTHIQLAFPFLRQEALANVPISRIIRFVEQHSESKRAYRVLIDSLLLELNRIPSLDAAKEFMQDSSKRIRQEVEQYQSELLSLRVGALDSMLRISVPAAAMTIAASGLVDPLLSGSVGSLGVGLSIFNVVAKYKHETAKLRQSPYSYLSALQRVPGFKQ